MEVKIRHEINQRCLGAIKLIDATTGASLRRPFNIICDNLTFLQNLSQLYVIKSAIGLESHTNQFSAAPQTPEVGSLSFNAMIDDPLKRYLSRRLTIALPRSDNPQAENSVMDPIEVKMFSAATASLNPNWSIIRVSLLNQISEQQQTILAGALLRVVRVEDEQLLSTGLSDDRGEALIIVPGIPVTNFSTEIVEDELEEGGEFEAVGSVVNVTTEVRVEVVVDPELSWPVNTDELEANAESWICNADQPTLIQLRTGRTETVTIQVTVTNQS